MRCVCKTKRDKKSAERTHQNDAAEEEETVMTTEQMALVKKLIQNPSSPISNTCPLFAL